MELLDLKADFLLSSIDESEEELLKPMQIASGDFADEPSRVSASTLFDTPQPQGVSERSIGHFVSSHENNFTPNTNNSFQDNTAIRPPRLSLSFWSLGVSALLLISIYLATILIRDIDTPTLIQNIFGQQ